MKIGSNWIIIRSSLDQFGLYGSKCTIFDSDFNSTEFVKIPVFQYKVKTLSYDCYLFLIDSLFLEYSMFLSSFLQFALHVSQVFTLYKDIGLWKAFSVDYRVCWPTFAFNSSVLSTSSSNFSPRSAILSATYMHCIYFSSSVKTTWMI